MAVQGTTVLNFGAAPGGTDASVAVSQPSMTGTEVTSAWVFPQATSDHNSDEHCVEDLNIVAGVPAAGVGFTIYAYCNTGMAYGQYTVAWVWN